jgi:hypothetical protein
MIGAEGCRNVGCDEELPMVTLTRKRRRRILVGINYGTKRFAVAIDVPKAGVPIETDKIHTFEDSGETHQVRVERTLSEVEVDYGRPPHLWYQKFGTLLDRVPEALIVKSKTRVRTTRLPDAIYEYDQDTDEFLLAAEVEDLAALMSVRLGPAIAELEQTAAQARTTAEERAAFAEAKSVAPGSAFGNLVKISLRKAKRLEAELRLQRQMQASINRYLAMMAEEEDIPDGPVPVQGHGA